METDDGVVRVEPDDVWILDRVEEGAWAILEGPGVERISIPRGWLPDGAREGHAFRVALAGEGDARTVTLTRDAESEALQRQRIEQVRARIPRGPGGDLEL
jgi:hypothetical protein